MAQRHLEYAKQIRQQGENKRGGLVVRRFYKKTFEEVINIINTKSEIESNLHLATLADKDRVKQFIDDALRVTETKAKNAPTRKPRDIEVLHKTLVNRVIDLIGDEELKDAIQKEFNA